MRSREQDGEDDDESTGNCTNVSSCSSSMTNEHNKTLRAASTNLHTAYSVIPTCAKNVNNNGPLGESVGVCRKRGSVFALAVTPKSDKADQTRLPNETGQGVEDKNVTSANGNIDKMRNRGNENEKTSN
uniref:DNA ligase n=1 Tax=Lygus hesperus TaxID=30085 RepID=A0A0A9XL56_LYGHE